jgi:hypothetical protein
VVLCCNLPTFIGVSITERRRNTHAEHADRREHPSKEALLTGDIGFGVLSQIGEFGQDACVGGGKNTIHNNGTIFGQGGVKSLLGGSGDLGHFTSGKNITNLNGISLDSLTILHDQVLSGHFQGLLSTFRMNLEELGSSLRFHMLQNNNNNNIDFG